jgi:beta-galactosidase
VKRVPLSILFAGFSLLAAVAVFGAQTAARFTVPLDGEWRFTFQEGTSTWAAPGFDDSAWRQVKLPHTWNAFDGQDGGSDYARGNGWYRTQFRVPANATAGRVLLEFDAASREAEVFVNGTDVGTHIGAFARFRFDVTDLVRKNEENLLAVRVNNSSNEFIPRRGDFTQWGGLYRPARLLITHPVHIATMDHASSGVFLVQRSATASRAEAEARVELANDSGKKAKGEVRVIVRDALGAMVKSASKSVQIPARDNSSVTLPLVIDKPRLWNGVVDPYLYRVTAELVVDGVVVDSVEQPLGLRAVEINPDTGLFLNGSHLRLNGVCRHQDRKDKGWAISEADQREDFSFIKEIGANAVRLAHYQQDQLFYDLCDAGGIAVWAELCWVSEPPDTEAGRSNAVEQLRELIRQNYNHPSIFFWSIGNETANTNAADNLLAELAKVVRAEDPTRPSVYASQHRSNDPRNFHTDILAVNKYFGWYLGDYADFGPWIDDYHRDHPQLRLGVSEYGAGGSIYQHEENPAARAHPTRGLWHPEEWQTRSHEENWLQMKSRAFLWGTFVWNLFDFAADNRHEGDQYGINDKGLVTYDRLTRKDAFYWYQANWTTNAMVHITSKRFAMRTNATPGLKVYSNCDEVEARLNGKSLGRKIFTDCRFIWPEIPLKTGVNRIGVTAYRGRVPVATDDVSWTFRAAEDQPRTSSQPQDEAGD